MVSHPIGRWRRAWGPVNTCLTPFITLNDSETGRRPFAIDAEATSTADMDIPFATGDAPGTDATMTVIVIVVSAGATAAVANDKHIA